ncbi:hypothetical protein PR048_030286 [Dryococelus australis]|uniref:Uncharacterized protein n=1 Tax=Dryococelus australis TaxID=614101 RepID=A0ABQ9G8K2_9NEOP|nr:hypothetical protein PR048_030286 [Dryococelus australis]
MILASTQALACAPHANKLASHTTQVDLNKEGVHLLLQESEPYVKAVHGKGDLERAATDRRDDVAYWKSWLEAGSKSETVQQPTFTSFSDVEPAFNFYYNDLTTTNIPAVMLKGDWDLWTIKWKNSKDELPKDAITALKKCEEILFPNLHILLEILATLPVTTASVEMSF